MVRQFLALFCFACSGIAFASVANEFEACVGESCAGEVFDTPQALEMLQMKSMAKVDEEHAEEIAQGAEDVEETDAEDDAEDGLESEDEEDANVTDDASVEEEEESSEDEQLPIGPKHKSGSLCKSCFSTRNFGKTKQSCSDMCSKNRKCKFFYFGHDQCGLCSSCGSTKSDSSYSIYKKWVLTFPVKNANCKEKFSEKSKGAARGCKRDATKNGYSFFAFKKKKCRRWKKCTNTKKANGWQVNKVR
mmetsp:Transcript_48797/g.136584  ORF Transcript_48797/g.136584 Transcript_48797/m.136584 type:complete len:247 (-) Transcript_48797:266-1006(-)